MKRRHFIRSTALSGTLLSFYSVFPFSISNPIPSSELIGKGSPELFGDGYLLRQKAHLAFMDMQNEALKSGVMIQGVSSYRNYEHQKRIWVRKYKTNKSQGLSPEQNIQKIIQYSTIPGTSRHHWGTDVDIVDGNHISTPNLLSASNFEKGKPFYKLRLWLEKNAHAYGYYIVYTNDESRKGFKYEPWHYSYKPLSKEYLNQYKELDILSILKEDNFEGSKHFTTKFITSYINENILDVNPELLP